MAKKEALADPIVVTVDELCGRLGALHEFVYYWLDKLKVNLTEGHVFDAAPDDPPVQGLPVEEAEYFLRKVRAVNEEHRSRWQAYVAYRDKRKREAAEERLRRVAEARRQSMEQNRNRAKMFQAAAAEEAAQEAAAMAAQQAEREGRPVDFDAFPAVSLK